MITKKIPAILIAGLFACCSPDASVSEDKNVYVNMYRDTLRSAANPSNPYDAAGLAFNEALDEYFRAFNPATSMSTIIPDFESAAAEVPNFVSLVDANYVTPVLTRVDYFINNPSLAIASAINASPLSSGAKSSLTNFAGTKLLECASMTSYDSIYNTVAYYEGQVLSNTGFTTQDKRCILSVTSIIRYSERRKKKPKKSTDHDWEINVTNIAPTIEGAGYSPASAASWAAVAGIWECN